MVKFAWQNCGGILIDDKILQAAEIDRIHAK